MHHDDDQWTRAPARGDAGHAPAARLTPAGARHAPAADPTPANVGAEQQRVGLAHVATASFLASRAVPTGGFAVALAGGVALARAAQRDGLRVGWGTSLAAMLQTVAIMGPARVGVPLTQAVSAPILGRMEARGHGTVAQALAAAVVRLGHNVPGTAFYIWIILGIDAYAGSYDSLFGFVPFLPEGRTGALVATAFGLVAWTIVGSTVQALVYRRGLRRWPGDAGAGAGARAPDDEVLSGPPDLPAGARPQRVARPPAAGRFDPRAVSVAAVVAFAVLLTGTAWPLLAAVSAWLAVAWVTSGGDGSAVKPGLVLTAILCSGTLVFGLVGGLGLELTVQRTLRAALLVLVATWLRYAAGEAGLREVFRRALRRLRRVPPAPETAAVLDGLGSPRALLASGRRLIARLKGVEQKPLPITDAVLAWVAGEAHHHAPAEPEPGRRLRVRRRDAALVVLAAATALALPLAA
jgi:hypothetical protein